jgi:hypothetical protein
MHPWYFDDERAWETIDPCDAWIFDKLVLAKMLGYECGPVGINVRWPGKYIVRPCVNFKGFGLGASIEELESETDHLPTGHFWCEIFTGKHLSVDFHYGEIILVVEGIRGESYPGFTRWLKWRKIKENIDPPVKITSLISKYEYTNCEFIGTNLIEVHLRRNPDFYYGNTEYIPIFDKNFVIPEGYTFVRDPGEHGRIGALIK